MRTLTLLLALALAGPVASAQRAKTAPDEDPVALAALLIADGNWDRAATVLDGIDPSARGLDVSRMYALRGLVFLQQQLYQEAAVAFRSAVEVDPEHADPAVHLYLARARLLGGDPAGALTALDAGGQATDGFPSAWLLRSRAQWASGDANAAYATLQEGARRFPAERDFNRQQVMLLVELGLSRQAAEQAGALLDDGATSVEDTLTIAEAMRQAGLSDRAAVLLEQARLSHPDDTRLLVRSAAVALELHMPMTAARFLQVASTADPSLAVESAELYRQAGLVDSALYMNAQVLDPVDKVRQRFGLLLDAQDFERALALEERLDRLGLLAEDPVAYGVAYAWFRIGHFEQAEALLKHISDPELFRQATALRDAMADCVSGGGCP